MKLVALIEFLRRHLKLVVRLCWLVLALLVVGDWLLVDKEHAHTPAEHWFGFWSVFGFVACVVIIFFSKWYGHRGIMKREDYYGDE
jgi:peptidoglycan/LPS O-acetylase OafA/YrhL